MRLARSVARLMVPSTGSGPSIGISVWRPLPSQLLAKFHHHNLLHNVRTTRPPPPLGQRSFCMRIQQQPLAYHNRSGPSSSTARNFASNANTTPKTATTAAAKSTTPGTEASASSDPRSKPIVSHEDIYTLPNALTLTRLLAAPVVGYLVLHDNHALALAFFTYAGVTDLVDGYIARKWNCQTVVGTILDPMADKCLMVVLTVCLAARGALPVWLAGVIISRDVALAISAIYYRWISLPPPKTFLRYWDFSLPSAEVRPTTISKYNTALQLGLIGLTMVSPLVSLDLSPVLTVLQYVVAVTTIWSGASYVFSKNAVKILNVKK